MMVTIDDETLARAVLTFCLDSADAMMYALVKGTGSAASALQLIADSGPGNHENVTAAACTSLDAAFINGVTRWGRTINARGMASFHGSLVSWQQRLASLPSKDPDALRDWFTADGTQWIIAPHHPCWPSQLIVGSRGVSDYGRQSAHELALRMARVGHLVVSGGALGTDAAAHWGAVKAMDEMSAALAGRTVAVFAGGLNHIGPKSNQNLFEQIESHSGALISELCPGTVPEARRFLLRNRLIAALSSTLIVAQARARSGALNTAGWANELNRNLFAVPGDITMPHNTGCNRLIQDGRATIICSLAEIDELCHSAHRPQHVDLPDDTEHPQESTDESDDAILADIKTCAEANGHVSADDLLDLMDKTHPGEYPVSRIMRELGSLELEGRISMRSGWIIAEQR